MNIGIPCAELADASGWPLGVISYVSPDCDRRTSTADELDGLGEPLYRRSMTRALRWPTQSYVVETTLTSDEVCAALAPHFTDERPRMRRRSDRPFFGVLRPDGFAIKTVVGAREASTAEGVIVEMTDGCRIEVVQRPRPAVYGAALTSPLISFGLAAFTVWTLSPDTLVRVLGIILPAALSLSIPARIIRVMFLPEVALSRHLISVSVERATGGHNGAVARRKPND